MIQIPLKTILLLALGASAAIVANMLTVIMIGQVNRKLPEKEQISYVSWDIGKVFHFHRAFYPRSKFIHLIAICGAVMLASFVVLVSHLNF